MAHPYKFEFVGDIATADAAFRAYGENLDELFAACAAALFDTIVELDCICPANSREVKLTAPDREQLLFAWLSELVYLKDTRRELYSRFEVRIADEAKEFKLAAEIRGEPFDASRHQARVDVKAVTYHKLSIEETDSGLEAFVVLDL